MIKAETLRSLEFDRILKAVGGYANCEATEEAVADLRPLEQRLEIEMRFGRVEEIRQLRQIGVSLPLSSFSEIRLILAAVRPEGAGQIRRTRALWGPACGPG